MALIAPSVLNSDFLNFGETISLINQSEADWVHLDVMDGSFVPNISFGIPIVEAAKKVSSKILDVHLMIVHPEKYLNAFREAGADYITIHFEACDSEKLPSILEQIRELGARPAIAIKPDTPIEDVFDLVEYLDMILVMSVFPGFGGQSFMEVTYERVRKLKAFLVANQSDALIQVDGGVSEKNAKQLADSGVDVMVVGSVIFKSENPLHTIADLKSLVR